MAIAMDEKNGVSSKLRIITMICGVMGIALLGYWGFHHQFIPSSSALLSIFFRSGCTMDGIRISPKMIFQMDWTHCMVLIIYVIMVLDFRPDIFIKCFLLLLGLSTMQLIQNIWTIIDKHHFLREQLSRAWQIAYEQDPGALEQIETQRQCRGFYHSEDRPFHFQGGDEDRIILQQGCYPLVVHQFGQMIYQWAILLLFIKCVQIVCGLVCYGVYVRYGHSQKDDNNTGDLEFMPISKIITI